MQDIKLAHINARFRSGIDSSRIFLFIFEKFFLAFNSLANGFEKIFKSKKKSFSNNPIPDLNLAVITGASSGIGEALCRLLASKGVNLLISGRDKNKLALLTESLSKDVKVITFPANLANDNDRKALIEKIHLYKPDLVINNAGFGLYGDALTYKTSAQTAILEVNGNAVLELTLEAARTLISSEKKGVILNVASAAAFRTFPALAVYSATKAFVVNFSSALDFETRPYDVRVLTSCPGMVDTNFSERAGGNKGSWSKRRFAMSSQFAAEQIWWQIKKGKSIHIFDWKTRLGIFLSYLIPKNWLFKLLKADIEGRLESRPFLKIDNRNGNNIDYKRS